MAPIASACANENSGSGMSTETAAVNGGANGEVLPGSGSAAAASSQQPTITGNSKFFFAFLLLSKNKVRLFLSHNLNVYHCYSEFFPLRSTTNKCIY